MNGLARIDRFLDTYAVGASRRPLLPSERALLRDGLVDYICHEQWLAPDPEAIGLVEQLLDLATGSDVSPAVAAALGSAARTIGTLARTLARREHANHIMREELACLSDLTARLRPPSTMDPRA
jgi:hypothetical protein